MAAQEQQRERVVLIQPGPGVMRRVKGDDGFLAAAAGALASPVVDEFATRDRDQPGAWMVGGPVTRPLLGRREQRLLYGILTGLELTVALHQHTEDSWRQVA